jgi:hypothetical protein
VPDHDKSIALQAEDGELVDLLTAVLVDPNLHTDRRMRLYQQVDAILRAARGDLYGAPVADGPEPMLERTDHELPDLLRAVLVDPNLYTDLRMRLHREIRVVLSYLTPALTGAGPATTP